MPAAAVAEHVATFRFYGALNDFLPAAMQGRDRIYGFDGTPSEACGKVYWRGAHFPRLDETVARLVGGHGR